MTARRREIGCCSRLRQRGSRRRHELDQPMSPNADPLGTVQSSSFPATTTEITMGGASVTSPNSCSAAGKTGRLMATRPATSSYANGRRQRGRRVERWSNGRLMRHNPEESREHRVQRALEEMNQLLQAAPQLPVHMLRAALIRYSQFASAPDIAGTWLALQARTRYLEARPEHVAQSQRKQQRAEQVTLKTWTSIFAHLGPFMGERLPRPNVALQSDCQGEPATSTTLKHAVLISAAPASAADTVRSTAAVPVETSLQLSRDMAICSPHDRVPTRDSGNTTSSYDIYRIPFREVDSRARALQVPHRATAMVLGAAGIIWNTSGNISDGPGTL